MHMKIALVQINSLVGDLNFNFNNKKIFILGAGGVVPSIIHASMKMGSTEILISNRTKEMGLRIW